MRTAIENRDTHLISSTHYGISTFSVTSGCSSVDRFNDPLSVRTHFGPLLSAKDHDDNLSIFELLLVAQIFVCRQQYLEPGGFCRRQ